MTYARIGRVCWVILFLTASGFCQSDRGSIRGTIADSSGAVIPNAKVTALNTATGVGSSTVTTGAGLYDIPSLPAGTYRVQVEHAGFKTLIREHVEVHVSDIVGLDLTMEVGAPAQTVSVQAAAPVLKTQSTELSTSVNPRTYLDLPINSGGGLGRIATSFMNLAPGVRGGNAFSYSTNGGQRFSHQILIDGLDVSGVYGNPGDDRPVTLPPDAIQEFTLVTNNYSAEFGNLGGGILSFTVRSGTNDFHGDAYEFLRNDAFDSRGFFPAEVARNRQHEYGGQIGGPVRIPGLYNGKNRSFFFFNLNRINVATFPSSGFISVPTPAFKAGDFSQLKDAQGNLIPIYDPATTRRLPGGGFTRDPFPGNIIPADRFSAVSKKVLAFYPDPTGPGIYNNFLERQVNNPTKDNFTIKIDQRIGSKHSVTLSLNRDNYSQLVCGNPCFDPGGWNNPGAQQFQDIMFQHRFIRLSYDWVATPALLLHVTAGANRQWQNVAFNSWDKGFPAKLGLTNVLPQAAFPYIVMPPYAQVGSNGNGAGGGNAVQGVESLTWVHGRHTFKFGGQHSWYFDGGYGPGNGGQWNFEPAETALPTALATTGSSLASMILGNVDTAFLDVGMQGNAYRYSYHAAYVQDDVKLRRNLTLNIGLRWDLWRSIYGVYDNYTAMDPTVPNPGCGGCPGALIYAGSGPGRSGRRKLTPPDVNHNFGPRLGIAWQIRPKTVIRTAYGINYFAPAPAGSSSFRGSALGFGAHPVFTTQDQGITPAFNWDNGFPAYTQPPFISPTFANGSDVGMWDSNATHPAYIQNWHFTVQHELAPGWLLETGYVASKGTRLLSGLLNPNQVNSAYLKYGALLTNSIYDPAVVAAGFKPPYAGFTGSLAQALRPFPQYNVVGAGDQAYAIWTAAQIGNSTYNSLQAKLQKQFSNGLFLLTSYTWSKNITDSGSALGAFFSTNARDQYNRKLEKSLSANNLPQRLVVAFNYELPIGPGKALARNATGVAKKILEGWQLNGVANYQSGDPIPVYMNNNLPLFNFCPNQPFIACAMPNVVSEVPQKLNTSNFDPGKGMRVLNASAFQVPAPYTYGNAPTFLNIRGFAFYNENLALTKRTYFFGERANVEFRLEFFNVFNRHQFGGVSSPVAAPPGGGINANLSDPSTFGAVNGAVGHREGQIAAKINF